MASSGKVAQTIKMERARETKTFIVFENKATREVLYVAKAGAADTIREAEQINVSVEVVE